MIRTNKIQIVNRDILLATENIIVQQVNCQGVMNSGLAKQLRNKYDGLYEGYKTWCKMETSPSKLLGTVFFFYVSPHKVIANVFGQLYYGRKLGVQYTDYDALGKGMVLVGERARQRNFTTAIPYGMGAGLGGGDWGIIRGIMESSHTTVNQYTKYYKLG